MRRLIQRCAVAALLVAAATTAGCGNDDNPSGTPTTPTVPAPQTTETFSGTLTANNAHTFPFTSGAGTLTLTLVSVAPDSAIALGVSIGTWSGTACTVGTGLFNDTALQGATITGQVSTFGNLCARVYDGAGQIAAPTTYKITVVHP
jgi:hypothetical protein